MTAESTLAQVVKELQSSNLSQDLILDTIDNYDFTLASNAARENTTEVPTFLDKLVGIAGDLKGKFDVLIRSNVVLAKRLEGNKLQERENRDELLDALRGLKPDKTRSAPAKNSKIEMPGGIFGGLLSVAALMGGFVTGFISQLTSPIFAALKNTKLFQKISSIFSTVSKFFTGIVLSLKNSPLFKGTFTVIEKIGGLLNKFKSSKIFTLLGKIFSIFGNSPVLKTITATSGIIGSAFSALTDIFGGMFRFFKIGLTLGSKFAGLFKFLGGPFTLALTGIISGIMGAIDGFKKDGLIGGLKGFLVGAFDGLIGGLLDLVKDGISWVSEKLGFSEFSKFLDSFSFTGLYSKYIIDPLFGMYAEIGKFIGEIPMMVTDFFTSLPDKISVFFTSAMDSLTTISDDMSEVVNNFNKAVLRAVLPDPKAKGGMSYYLKLAIPDSLYEYAYSSSPKEKESTNSTSEKLATAATSSEKILKATSTNNFTELSKTEKAMAAGYGSWDEYAASDFKWKANIKATPLTTGNTLATAGNVANISPTIVVNNNNGGNTNNISSSNVNNNMPQMMPILTGSAMGY
jgi:hypothetical protein